ncbi:accessory Sec-dependent serine-rich glycoprotein adhesin, partial [Streptococcus sp. 27098_8_74]|uniref:accessory Sec-dependent serine-rich glycoprotein adhesin n=1 Tax=Streptococcus sp. 27098_8_74 TaxID=3003646 RepID=UPI00352D4925
MFFRRNAGKYRETDRVTRFKLIKSGKNWLRAATANFGLFKVVKGSADAPSVSAQSVEEKTPVLSGQALLKGIAAAGALAGGAVTTYTAQAEEMTSPALERQLTANQDVTANSDSVVLSTASVSEASVVASTSQESTSSSVDTQASTDASISLSQSVSQSVSQLLSAELSQAISESASLSKEYSTSESQSHTESASGSNSESVSESATSTRSATSETATQDDKKTILDQNVSEAELLVNIAKNYQAKLTDTAAKAEIQTAIASVQEEVAKSTTLLAASATNAAYAEQRERLGSAVEGMLTKITNAGFNGNSTVSGSPAIISNLNLAKGETKVYIGSGTDTVYNVPIYYKLTVKNDGKKLTFVYNISYDNPATSTIEKHTKIGYNHTLYNTGTGANSTQPMFTLGKGLGTPSSVTSYLTDSSGARFTNNNRLRDNTTPIDAKNPGYTWANGAQLTGYFARQGYGLTSTWTVPINGEDTSFTFTPYVGADDDPTFTNYLNGKIVESDTTSQSRSLSQSLSIVQSTVVSNSVSKSQATSKSVSQSLSTVASESIRKSNETSRSLSTSESLRTSLSQSQSTSHRISQSVSTSSSLSAFNSQSLSSSISQSTSQRLSQSASTSSSLSTSRSQSLSSSISQSLSTSASRSASASARTSLS